MASRSIDSLHDSMFGYPKNGPSKLNLSELRRLVLSCSFRVNRNRVFAFSSLRGRMIPSLPVLEGRLKPGPLKSVLLALDGDDLLR